MALTGDINDDDSSDGSREEIAGNLPPSGTQSALERCNLVPLTPDENKDSTEKFETLTDPPPNNNEGNRTYNNDDKKNNLPPEVGVGLLAGISGLFLLGPFFGAVAGAAAAFAASKNEGPVGDAARSTGEFVLETGSKVGDAAKEADQQYGVIDKLKDMFSFGWAKVQQFDEKHKASEKVKETVSNMTEKTIEFERQNHIMENILVGVQNGVSFLLDKIRNAGGHEQNNSPGREIS